ncbi:hypothetical protein EXIGLDRAFT_717351 [Exidia glandulosa HHB12029]|uniref:Peptide N-acetyl-beta-D-glucosaminyl asparaginase amidase A N-terminal domain-containing protein n=1 Tax=Exidia glandulosa HHB12029 TaxID=1314781 RepID=A0A165IGN4_EXIGL|nr:hypothetical protein EXIGLDRAFT_717351 [Exidia glandulosa HHB12029]
MWSAVAFVALSSTVAGVSGALVNFQVAQPPVVPSGVKTCTHSLLERNFANSYYQPEIVEYVPPTDCGAPGSWTAITLNWTATSNGTQYDRLSAISFHNVEVWRTSTPEPTLAGIIWTYLKDVTLFTPLFAKPGRLILDLNNIVDPSQGITGEYFVRLSVTFYASNLLHPPAKAADTILPLSNFSPDQANYVSVPPALDTVLTFPRNSVSAFAELYASGNSQDEEFWYFDTANEYIDKLPSGAASPRGPYREVRLLVDGQLAGSALPWAVFFTGAINPLVWRPIPAYGALDLPRYYVDLTPFIPKLADGLNHTVTVDIISAEDDHATNQNWYVSGNIQVFVDSTSKPTTGKITKYSASPYPISQVTGSVAENGDVNVTVSATRSLTIEAEIVAGSGKKTLVHWSQNLSYVNKQTFTDDANSQTVKQKSSGTSVSLHNGIPVVSDIFSYPVDVDFALYPDGSGYTVVFDHTYTRSLLPNPLTYTTNINSYQHANGSIWALPTGGRTGNGTNINSFKYLDLHGNSYTRDVAVTNNTISYDRVGGSLAGSPFQFVLQPAGRNVLDAARLPLGRASRRFGSGF